MRNVLVTIYLLVCSQCEAGSYWIQYFNECSAITEDPISCFNDITPQLLSAVRKEAGFDTRECSRALEESKRILKKLESDVESFNSAMVLVRHKDSLGTYACMSSKAKRIQQLAEISIVKHQVLKSAARAGDSDLCEELYTLESLVELSAQSLIEDGRKCVERSASAKGY